MPVLHAVFHQILQQLRRHTQIIIKIRQHLQIPLGEDPVQIPLGNIEQLGKLPVLLQPVHLSRRAGRARGTGPSAVPAGSHASVPAGTNAAGPGHPRRGRSSRRLKRPPGPDAAFRSARRGRSF